MKKKRIRNIVKLLLLICVVTGLSSLFFVNYLYNVKIDAISHSHVYDKPVSKLDSITIREFDTYKKLNVSSYAKMKNLIDSGETVVYFWHPFSDKNKFTVQYLNTVISKFIKPFVSVNALEYDEIYSDDKLYNHDSVVSVDDKGNIHELTNEEKNNSFEKKSSNEIHSTPLIVHYVNKQPQHILQATDPKQVKIFLEHYNLIKE